MRRAGLILQRINPALLIDHRVTMETGGDDLVGRCVGQHVAGELFQGKLIKWHIGIERVDYPVAPRPDGTRSVLLIAVGVSVTGEVQPTPCPALAVMR